jgi:transcriptional regulator with XRE-family HTH domain
MSKEDEIRRRQFGRRLQKALNARGWTQSELARRIASLLKPTFRIGRDNVSKWVRGKVLPLPPALEAICKILEMETNELLPERATPIPELDDHSAYGERERLQEALEEAHKDKAFYREIIAGLQGQVAGLQANKASYCSDSRLEPARGRTAESARGLWMAGNRMMPRPDLHRHPSPSPCGCSRGPVA